MVTRKRVLLTLAILASMTFIFYMSAQDGEHSQQMSDGIVEEIVVTVSKYVTKQTLTDQMVDSISFLVRKAAHMTEYAVLAFFCIWLASDFSWEKWKWVVSSWGFATVYAATDEFHQYFSSGRSAQVRDVCIDSAGAMIGILAFLCVCAILKRRS